MSKLGVRLLSPVLACALMGAAGGGDRSVHERMVVLDTHFDTPANLGRPGWSIVDRHDTVLDGDQVDLPRMIEGGVDGGFFVVFTPQGPRTPEALQRARDQALARSVQIREMVSVHSDVFRFAVTAEDARDAVSERKRFVFLSLENASPVESDLTLMRTFRGLGATMMGIVHFRNNGLADSATDIPEWKGLSPQGIRFVEEANRLGILLDGSHASDQATRQMVQLSKAPIILSHSGMRGVYDHPRNVPDDVAKLVAARAGVIQINAFSAYMIDQPKNTARDAALRELAAPRPDATRAERRAYRARRAAIEARHPVPRADLDDLVKHLIYAIRLVGIDHVGISGDFDGGGGVTGFDDVADFPKVTEALLKAGYGEADVAKICGGNALRVLAAAQSRAAPDAVPEVPRPLKI